MTKTKTSGIIVDSKSFRNEYGGETLRGVLTQMAFAKGTSRKYRYAIVDSALGKSV